MEKNSPMMVCIDLIGLQQSGFTSFLHMDTGGIYKKHNCNCSINDCKLVKHELTWPKVLYCAPVISGVYTDNRKPMPLCVAKAEVVKLLPIRHFYEPNTVRRMLFGQLARIIFRLTPAEYCVVRPAYNERYSIKGKIVKEKFPNCKIILLCVR